MLELTLPELGENIETAEVSAVLVSAGDLVRRDQPVIEVETEKASLEVPSTVDGRVAEVLVQAGSTVRVGQVMLRVEAQESALEPVRAEAAPPPPEPARPASPAAPAPAPVLDFPVPPSRERPEIGRTVPAAPSVRALARQLGVDVTLVPGSGPRGRITRDDVKAYAKSLIQTADLPALRATSAPPLPDFSRWGEIERQPLTNVRRATARGMAEAWSNVPHVTQFDRADVTALETARKEFNRGLADEAGKLSVTAIAAKLSADALKRFPKFNSSLDLDDDAVVHKKYVHVGIAVDTERGLLVPVIRDVDRKSLPEVAAEMNDLAARARAKKLAPDEMRGGTFTVSNLGGLGTTYFSPIVNWPEVAILGIGRAHAEPIFDEGSWEPRLIMPLSLSYDHRLIDGADAARFLRWLAEAFERPLPLDGT